MGKIYAPYRSLAALYFWRAADAAKLAALGKPKIAKSK
jgi:3-methyladenine DNA glycosylase/8-oxoguanine DNA glycosylase